MNIEYNIAFSICFNLLENRYFTVSSGSSFPTNCPYFPFIAKYFLRTLSASLFNSLFPIYSNCLFFLSVDRIYKEKLIENSYGQHVLSSICFEILKSFKGQKYW